MRKHRAWRQWLRAAALMTLDEQEAAASAEAERRGLLRGWPSSPLSTWISSGFGWVSAAGLDSPRVAPPPAEAQRIAAASPVFSSFSNEVRLSFVLLLKRVFIERFTVTFD